MSTKKTIAKSFTVSTIEDGVSVQAQYAPNANPTSGQIHTVWQNGDLYMRTRESDESAWSSWHKIVGESGGETDYQFALSANLVTQDGTSATAPSDISSSAWQDAPMATTTQKPYLWSKVQKKDGNGNNVGSATYIRLTGEEGKDGLSPNPNILLRTIFDDGIDKVSEKWSFDSSYVSIDTTSDTVVEGRKSIRLNSQNNVNGVGFTQSVLGKIKPNTWYTASFNAFHTAGGSFAMSFYNLIGGSRHLIYDGNVIVDGVARTIVADSCDVIINAAWDGARHTVTFKTRSSEHISTTRLDFVFWQGYSSSSESPHSQTAICMPKLEIGEVATAYMANEDDLKGDQGDKGDKGDKGEKGDKGDRGKVGRFFYFAGTFNPQDDDPTHVFVVNDAQAPYFEHTETVTTQSGTTTIKRYHVFNYDTNGTYTMSQMWSISNQSWSTPWEVMTNDFKYIITQALFAAYAQLGSWIFNSDYMLSEKDGNGNPRGQQAYNGMGDSQLTSGFIPSISFDALNGRASFGGDKVRFQPNGAGWLANKNIQWDANGKSEFSGIIHASLMYSNTIDVDGGAYTIDPENSPANTFMGHGTLTLPSAEDYLGLELKFFEPYPTTRGYQPPITLLPQSNEYIAKTYFDIVPLLKMVTQYTVPMGRFVTLKATNLWYNGHEYYCWMVVSGDDGGYSGTVQIGNKTMTYLNGMLMDVETV